MANIMRALLLLFLAAALVVHASPTDPSLAKRKEPRVRNFEGKVDATCYKGDHVKGGYEWERNEYCSKKICKPDRKGNGKKCPGTDTVVNPIDEHGYCQEERAGPGPGQKVVGSHCVCYYPLDKCPEDKREWSCKKGGLWKFFFCDDD